MEKVININFQGRVIPIEEGAYNELKKYIDSLRSHFANEESNDEIINDIENRIAELFTDRLKRGANCITPIDVSAVVDSIGRLEDIEAAEGEEHKNTNSSQGHTQMPPPLLKNRFFRNADDKVIAGVCSGIAVRTGIDPVIVRILFVLLSGALFWIYILLWIIVPSQSLQSNITRRLYRNPDDKVIAGVCSGLAVYFRVDTWVPRLIFVLPLIIGIISHGLHFFWWHWHGGFGPGLFAGSFGSTLFILYVILWIALPYARSSTDRLEMRGEKIDMNSIKAATQAKASSAAYSTAPRRGGIGRVIGILFKSFFLFIAGIIALSLFGVLIGLVFTGSVAIPYTHFLLDGWGQYALAWTGFALFLGIPLLAFITWIVRRLMGIRSHRHYLGYIFAGLWVVGLICAITLSGIILHNFSSRSMVEETYTMNQPSVKKLYINVSNDYGLWSGVHHGRWFEDGDERDMPFHIVDNDSLWLNTVKIKVVQSTDSLFHIYETMVSRGNTSQQARELATHISFNISQLDSIVTLPRGFCISNKDKFHNQQVLITVEAPLGRAIQFGKNINDYSWFSINTDGGRDFYRETHWYNNHNVNRAYIMTASGLKDPSDTTNKDNDGEDDGEN